ncbi:MAG: NFACT family protein [Clostridiales bacterium]|nr:NFACT family protein [Clostridiales bacterium]
MDGLSLSAVVYELKAVIGGRIEKVQQPERDELLISIHSTGGSNRLLISASPENCRILLTDEKKVSPVDAPAFLMLMRKYLTGARIVSVSQPNMDRVVEFGIETYSELHDAVRLTLVAEIMGRHSNIILIGDDGNVIDAIRRVGPSVSSARLVLPKLKYEYPPSRKKNDPREASPEDFERVLSDHAKPAQALSDNYYGLSPAVASKLTEALGFPECGVSALSERLSVFYGDFTEGRFSPCIVTAGEKAVMTLPFIPKDTDSVHRFTSMSEAVSAYYVSRAQDESIKRRTSSYEHIIRNAVSKLERKLMIFDDAISSEEENEKLKRYGELLTSNLYLIPHKTDKTVVTDYYSDPPVPVEIPLDAKLSAADNAQKYFSRYRKAKLARDHAVEMKEQTADELNYLDELLYTLSCCEGEAELNEIRQELIAGGYVSDDSKKQKKGAANKLPPSKPYSFTSRDGIKILVGKNNRQNDKLTMSTAYPDDVWLHTKDIHGSHVIIRRSGKVPDATLYDAAMLAAYYSKARGSANVPVDYTEVKYVKKPSGAKPGMVIYSRQHTVYVTPDPEHIKKLMQ